MNRGVLKRIFSYLRPNAGLLVLAVLFAAGGVLLSLYIPVLIGKGVDCIVQAGKVDFDGLAAVLLRLVIAAVLSACFLWLMNYCTNKITYKTVVSIRTQAFERLAELPLGYIDSHSHGDILSRITTDVEQVSDGLLQGFAQLFTGILTIAGTVFFMVSLSSSLSLVVIFLTPLSLIAAAVLAKSSYKKFCEQSQLRGEITGLAEEMLTNHNVIRLFSYQQEAQARFEKINSRLHTVGIKAQFFSSLTNPGTRFINGIVYAAVAVGGAAAVINGSLSVGMLSGFLAYASQYTKPFNEISGVITELQNALASTKRIFELIDEQAEENTSTSADSHECDGSVTLKDVYFSYNKNKPLIEALELSVEAGQKIAVVGPTGCGKTTLINLLMRFYDVGSGEILVSGKNIRSMRRSTLRSMFGMVLQDTWLFSGTISDNIAYGKPDASIGEIEAAARAAFAHDFIKRLPNGYDTVISADGEGISQGERQLLCISRIMLTQPPILILDEATSSIDTRTEIKIQQAFSKIMKGRTSFIVAHRLSTVKNADVIIVMDKGRVIEQGSHGELLERHGFYYRLYRSRLDGSF